MSTPLVNVGISTLNLPPHMFALVDADFLSRLDVAATEMKKREAAAQPENPWSFRAEKWKRLLFSRVLDVPTGRGVK